MIVDEMNFRQADKIERHKDLVNKINGALVEETRRCRGYDGGSHDRGSQRRYMRAIRADERTGFGKASALTMAFRSLWLYGKEKLTSLTYGNEPWSIRARAHFLTTYFCHNNMEADFHEKYTVTSLCHLW